MAKLADCTMLTKGKPPAEMPYYGDDAEPYLSPEYLRGNGTAELAKPATNAVRVKDGDTILLWDGSNAGEVFRARAGLLASTMTHVGHGDEFEPEYFRYATKRWEAYLKSQTSGSGIPHVDKEMLGKLEILKLPPDEQKLVANILNKLDRTIEQTEALIAKQQRIKTGLMQDLLTKGIDEHGNIRSEAIHAFKDSPLGRIPVEWDVVKVEEVLAENPKNGYSPKESESFTGALMLGLGCLTAEGFKPAQLKNAPPDDPRVHGALLNHRDFLISRSNTRELVGLVGIFKEIGTTCIYPDLMVRLRFDDSVSSEFMEHAFRHHILRLQITGAAVGTSGSMVKINSQVIKGCCFLRPPRDEQGSIVRFLGELAETILKMNRQMEKFQLLKRGLMHDLLTGQRRVTPLLAQAATP
jgi:type I restriction enzyme S subunit